MRTATKNICIKLLLTAIIKLRGKCSVQGERSVEGVVTQDYCSTVKLKDILLEEDLGF